jgi:hypothetical protein
MHAPWSLKMKFCELIIFFCRFERFLQAAIMVIFCGLLVFNVLPGWDGGAGGLGFTGMFATIQSQKPIANNASAGFFAAIIIIVRCSSPCDITQPAAHSCGLSMTLVCSRSPFTAGTPSFKPCARSTS